MDETWGLDAHVASGVFVTCGHDKLLQVWSAEEKKVLRAKEMPVCRRVVVYLVAVL